LARGLSANCDERAAPAFSNAISGANLDAKGQPHRAADHAQASATSPSLNLIIALDHLLSGVSRIVSTRLFGVKEKVHQSTTNSDPPGAYRPYIGLALLSETEHAGDV
jgi:hypothetical protein